MNDRNIPFYAYETAVATLERTIKRLWILLIIVFTALVLTNSAWLIYEMQYEDVSVTETYQDGSGVNIIGQDVNYGTESTKD